MKNVLIVWWTQEGVELRRLEVEKVSPKLLACNNRFINIDDWLDYDEELSWLSDRIDSGEAEKILMNAGGPSVNPKDFDAIIVSGFCL